MSGEKVARNIYPQGVSGSIELNINSSFCFGKNSRLHNNNFYLNVTEWVASPVGTTFSNLIEGMLKEELNFCL